MKAAHMKSAAPIRRIHPIAGTIALLTIASFWLATVVAEIWGSAATITLVKTAIPWGFLLLVPALAATGGSGVALAQGGRSGLPARKRRRMAIIAANGILVLIPSALFLAARAGAGRFDTGFVLVQAIELVAGAVNITLLCLNLRDGIRMARGRKALPSG
ncbi:MAG: hypothetical protein CMO30_01940 [Tistrella sp.]|jgi:hypothetical protein|uniref:Uncharacterized protein n=1 Tax=Tistrella mobilis TaxID=171437 RepID=A0A3B9IGX4_9PROT|nr:hypothetical protein [Tistrella sp.]MAD40401.1 hypothetical protein [Tistrella sp.]MBA74039.1 hypothetical protein [Tistrella sp.]HAE47121.1 hypothetical protein [Tistrella mobilis]